MPISKNDKGRITAHDIEWNRLKEVPTRANRAGIRSVWASVDEKRPTRRSSKDIAHYDIVLVDAPCSGMGTVRRLPMVKWRLTPQTLERHAKKQLSVLEQYAPHVRDGGILVYATCSILPEENEDVVAAFLKAHPEAQSRGEEAKRRKGKKAKRTERHFKPIHGIMERMGCLWQG
ncbi:MAG: hypothetical protein IPM83_06280 [Ignavibacteria bacterium]|nr:hypothetical protein [Ignavibacteria bacterium]